MPATRTRSKAPANSRHKQAKAKARKAPKAGQKPAPEAPAGPNLASELQPLDVPPNLYTDMRALQARCLAMVRSHGEDWFYIGDKLGIKPSRARRLCERAIKATDSIYQADKDLFRHLELQRLDEMQGSIYEQAIGKEQRVVSTMAGDIVVRLPSREHIETVLKIMRQRAELFGLKAPEQREITGKDGGPITLELIDSIMQGAFTGVTGHQLPNALHELPAPPDEGNVQDAELVDE